MKGHRLCIGGENMETNGDRRFQRNWRACAARLSLAFLCCASALAQPAPPCVPPPDGLAAWWPFDGNTADFTSGSVGVIVGNPVFTNGLVGQAMFFDGNGDGVMSTPTNSLNVGTTGGFSIEMWINMPN